MSRCIQCSSCEHAKWRRSRWWVVTQSFTLKKQTVIFVNDNVRTLFFALDANDYRSGPYHVHFAEGEKQACAEIPVTEDNLDEPDEMFLLQIMPDPEGVPNIMPGPMAETQVTIKSGKY